MHTSQLHGEGPGSTIHVKQFRGASPTAHKTADGKVCVRCVPARRSEEGLCTGQLLRSKCFHSSPSGDTWSGKGEGRVLPIIKSELLSTRERTESHSVLTPVCSLYLVCFRLSEPGVAEGHGGKDLGFAAGDGTFLARSLPFKVPSSCRLLGQCGLWAGLLEPPTRGLVL